MTTGFVMQDPVTTMYMAIECVVVYRYMATQ